MFLSEVYMELLIFQHCFLCSDFTFLIILAYKRSQDNRCTAIFSVSRGIFVICQAVCWFISPTFYFKLYHIVSLFKSAGLDMDFMFI